ncbi:MAG: hypothetical protein ABI383_11200 [Acidobacteriaceae bacterium]
MKNTRKPKPVAAEAIARLAAEGKDISHFFTNTGSMNAANPFPEQRRAFGAPALRPPARANIHNPFE